MAGYNGEHLQEQVYGVGLLFSNNVNLDTDSPYCATGGMTNQAWNDTCI
jgi:hypothetical protein